MEYRFQVASDIRRDSLGVELPDVVGNGSPIQRTPGRAAESTR
jgi:hypothetical protein